MVLGVDPAMPSNPALLLEPIEAATEARWRDPHHIGHVLRTRPPLELSQRREHLERTEWDSPLPMQIVVDAPVDLEHDALQITPGGESVRIEPRHCDQIVDLSAFENAATASSISAAVTTSGGIQRTMLPYVPALISRS